MKGGLTNVLFKSPGAIRFIAARYDDLAQERSLIVLLPDNLDPALLWAALRGELWRRDFLLREVVVNDLTDDAAPASALAQALGVQWPTYTMAHTATTLMSREGLPQIIHLDGMELLPPERQRRWLDLFTQWALAAQTVSASIGSPPSLCAVIPAHRLSVRLPQSQPKLAIQHWWGTLSALEVRLLCRGEDGVDGAVIQWREHMLSSLAGADLSLVEELWEADLEMKSLLPRLSDFATRRGWTADSLSTWGAERWMMAPSLSHHGVEAVPSDASHDLWAHGALHWTPEYGTELHTAALALLGRREDVRHRCWRGQATMLLPLIDDLRLKVCADLSARFGGDWPVKWYRNGAPEEADLLVDPFACEWGRLELALSYCPDRQTRGWWLEAVKQARWLRNELAHYRPVSFDKFNFFTQELRRPRY
jgi:hypothetical protein